ncbi:hypothetical protein NKG94_40295 [Micromonospora sp. M12]
MIECTGAPTVVLDVMCKAAPTGIVCLAGCPVVAGASTSTPGHSTARWSWRTTWCSAR